MELCRIENVYSNPYILFLGLLHLAVGERSLSHAPRTKTRTNAELSLKKGQPTEEKS